MELIKGVIIKTSYGSRNYKIVKAYKCSKCSVFKPIDGEDIHYHLTLKNADDYTDKENYYLNGYRSDGSNIWNNDQIFLVSNNNAQLSLF